MEYTSNRKFCFYFTCLICWCCCFHFGFVSADKPTVVRVGVVLSVGSSLPYDYNALAPALEAAYEEALRGYNIQFQPVLCLYKGGCSTDGASGQTYNAINQSVDLILGNIINDK